MASQACYEPKPCPTTTPTLPQVLRLPLPLPLPRPAPYAYSALCQQGEPHCCVYTTSELEAVLPPKP